MGIISKSFAHLFSVLTGIALYHSINTSSIHWRDFLPREIDHAVQSGQQQSMAPPTLYHVPKTISSPIFMLISELGLASSGRIQVHTHAFTDLKTPEYLGVNPMGTSPAFTDESRGIVMWESGAILTYVLEAYDRWHRFYPPVGDLKRPKFLQLQHFITVTVYPFVSSWYLHTFKPIEEQDPEYLDSAAEKWRSTIGPILVKALGDGAYLMGDAVSAVDLVAAKPLNNINSLGLLDETPTLRNLFRRIEAMPSFAEAYAVVEPSKVESRATADQELHPTNSIPLPRPTLLMA